MICQRTARSVLMIVQFQFFRGMFMIVRPVVASVLVVVNVVSLLMDVFMRMRVSVAVAMHVGMRMRMGYSVAVSVLMRMNVFVFVAVFVLVRPFHVITSRAMIGTNARCKKAELAA
jgi:hypothetical protein